VSNLDRLKLSPDLTTRWATGNDNFVFSSLWDFKSSFTCRKILRHGTFPLYFPSERKVCCGRRKYTQQVNSIRTYCTEDTGNVLNRFVVWNISNHRTHMAYSLRVHSKNGQRNAQNTASRPTCTLSHSKKVLVMKKLRVLSGMVAAIFHTKMK
jgi:hypothetical protein